MKKTTCTIPAISALALVSSSMTFASDNDMDGWYFSPMLSYIKADSDRQADDDFGLHLGFGKQIDNNWDVELSFVMDTLGFEAGSGEYEQKGLVIDGLYFFDRQEDIQTYALIGAGILATDIGTNDSTNPMVNIGIGTMHKITDDGIKLRADIRYRMDMDDQSISTEDRFDDLQFNIGFTIPFGDKAQPARTTSASINKDSDNDGVMDNADRCPGTAARAKVDDKGCKIEVVASMKEKDGDNDGVKDSLDECPATAAGINVDNKGCELQQSFVLKGVNFVTGSSQLTDTSKQALNDVAETLMNNNELRVEVAGYTDNRGNAKFNQRLSQTRAESVKSYLVTKGVNTDQVVAKGYGEANSLADNSTSQGRAQNRRVELHILK